MSEPQVAPYGAWRSPISTELFVAGAAALGQIALDGADLYWTEMRPSERGRQVIVRAGRAPGAPPADMTPAPFSADTHVHEYGGGAFTVADGVIFFANAADGRVYRQDSPPAAPRPISPPGDELRYADFAVDRQRSRLICVCEIHTAEALKAHGEPVNVLAALDWDGEDAKGGVLSAGADFYAAPRLSPDGRRLAWLSWNHPDMPWDATELWVGELDAGGAVAQAQCVAGGPAESVCQPEWTPDGALIFVSDRTGWWNLYRWRGGDVEPLAPREAEFGLPAWLFGMSTYAVVSSQELICAYATQGIWRLAALDMAAHRLDDIATPYTEIHGLRAGAGRVAFMAGAPDAALALVQLDLASGRFTTVRRSSPLVLDAGYVSLPEPITFPTGGGLTAHGLFYGPRNRDFVAPPGERPPLLVMSHGGPTGAASTALRLIVQYWTSRGIAVLDVNYGGSTGYGRAYRERLNGGWGVVDVADCVNGARFLAERGDVDGARLAIRGSSAGGYTALCALTFHDLFRAGASYYGVADLEALARDTHKFEARYLDRLVGPYPEQRGLYRARSPIHFTERLACPVIFFQGLDDRVVPPSQSKAMAAAVRARGLPTAYLTFEGEGHGFRRAETIRRTLEAELAFYAGVFGFPLGDTVTGRQVDK